MELPKCFRPNEFQEYDSMNNGIPGVISNLIKPNEKV